MFSGQTKHAALEPFIILAHMLMAVPFDVQCVHMDAFLLQITTLADCGQNNP